MTKELSSVYFLLLFLACFSSEAFANKYHHEHATNEPTASWDWFTLRKYLMYAYSALCTQSLQDWTCYWCTKTAGVPAVNVTLIFHNDGDAGTYGYVGFSNESIVLSFRGSVSAQNWMTDFDFVKSPYPDVKDAAVHSGFWHEWTAVNTSVVAAVLALRESQPELPVLLTGHSSGAALSQLCAVELRRLGVGPVSVFNFGCPRLGNKAFADYYHTVAPTTFRIINQRDLVPHYPAQTMGYHHVATEVWFEHNTTAYVVCDSSGEDPHCSDSLVVLDPFDHTTYLGFTQSDGFSHHCGNV
eukprot:TRINITY_DN12605_c0_g1_i1.p1 TRINITY_DN12605_c0_g1~~TRINITY_DN12605_c0_g1_i1.p1  ORF type:complete len:299 (-),score=80.14 TRINITY_DN12605_c0_g1_i1:107-1003(-)